MNITQVPTPSSGPAVIRHSTVIMGGSGGFSQSGWFFEDTYQFRILDEQGDIVKEYERGLGFRKLEEQPEIISAAHSLICKLFLKDKETGVDYESEWSNPAEFDHILID